MTLVKVRIILYEGQIRNKTLSLKYNIYIISFYQLKNKYKTRNNYSNILINNFLHKKTCIYNFFQKLNFSIFFHKSMFKLNNFYFIPDLLILLVIDPFLCIDPVQIVA
jgi:hypothetical protein